MLFTPWLFNPMLDHADNHHAVTPRVLSAQAVARVWRGLEEGIPVRLYKLKSVDP
jgi:hypothetical protein